MSVLFCDIQPDFYSRLGYLLCPSNLGWAAANRGRSTGGIEDGWQLVPAGSIEDFAGQAAAFAELYDSDHGQRALVIDRSVDYWQHLVARQPNDERFWLVTGADKARGYVWLRTTGHDLVIDDHAVRDGDESARAALFARSSISRPGAAWRASAAGCRRTIRPATSSKYRREMTRSRWSSRWLPASRCRPLSSQPPTGCKRSITFERQA